MHSFNLLELHNSLNTCSFKGRNQRLLQGPHASRVNSHTRTSHQPAGTQHPMIWLQDSTVSSSQESSVPHPYLRPQNHATNLKPPSTYSTPRTKT